MTILRLTISVFHRHIRPGAIFEGHLLSSYFVNLGHCLGQHFLVKQYCLYLGILQEFNQTNIESKPKAVFFFKQSPCDLFKILYELRL